MTPAYEKTWQHAHNLWRAGNDIHGLNGSQSSHIEVWLQLFETLAGWPLSPWIVDSSCNGSVAHNNDQTNVVVTDTDFTFATAGNPHTWIVMKQPGLGLGGNASFLVDFASANWWTPLITFSATGFGAVNGGADGTTTARPTGLNELPINNLGQTWQLNANAGGNQIWNFSQSTDGEVTRIWQMNNTGNRIHTFMSFEKVKDPIAVWDSPVCVRHHVGAPSMTLTQTWQSAETLGVGIDFQHGGAAGRLRLMHAWPHGFIGSGSANARRPNDTVMLPALLMSSTTGLVGVWGTLFDLYISPYEADGTLVRDADGVPTWVTIGDIWVPVTPAGLLGARG